MIISHEHRFVFLHCRKTAGSSITCYLNDFLGPWDLQVGAWEDVIVSGGSYNFRLLSDLCSVSSVFVLPKNVIREVLIEGSPRRAEVALSRAINQSHKRLYKDKFGVNAGHATAESIRKYLDGEWGDYFKFCFVRNPYDKAVSDYEWRTRGEEDVTFLEFLRRVENPSRDDPEDVVPVPRTNWEIYTINDEVAVDFVGRYERLKEDLEVVCNAVGLPFEPSRLPYMKVSTGAGADYGKYYDVETRGLVRKIYRRELDHFDYEY